MSLYPQLPPYLQLGEASPPSSSTNANPGITGGSPSSINTYPFHLLREMNEAARRTEECERINALMRERVQADYSPLDEDKVQELLKPFVVTERTFIAPPTAAEVKAARQAALFLLPKFFDFNQTPIPTDPAIKTRFERVRAEAVAHKAIIRENVRKFVFANPNKRSAELFTLLRLNTQKLFEDAGYPYAIGKPVYLESVKRSFIEARLEQLADQSLSKADLDMEFEALYELSASEAYEGYRVDFRDVLEPEGLDSPDRVAELTLSKEEYISALEESYQSHLSARAMEATVQADLQLASALLKELTALTSVPYPKFSPTKVIRADLSVPWSEEDYRKVLKGQEKVLLLSTQLGKKLQEGVAAHGRPYIEKMIQGAQKISSPLLKEGESPLDGIKRILFAEQAQFRYFSYYVGTLRQIVEEERTDISPDQKTKVSQTVLDSHYNTLFSQATKIKLLMLMIPPEEMSSLPLSVFKLLNINNLRASLTEFDKLDFFTGGALNKLFIGLDQYTPDQHEAILANVRRLNETLPGSEGAILGELYRRCGEGSSDPKWSENHFHEHINELKSIIINRIRTAFT